MIRTDETARCTGLTRGMIISKVKAGEFPAPVVAVPRQARRWHCATVDSWLAAHRDALPVRVAPEPSESSADDAEADRERRKAEGKERRFRAVRKADLAHLRALYEDRRAERLRREALERKVA